MHPNRDKNGRERPPCEWHHGDETRPTQRAQRPYHGRGLGPVSTRRLELARSSPIPPPTLPPRRPRAPTADPQALPVAHGGGSISQRPALRTPPSISEKKAGG